MSGTLGDRLLGQHGQAQAMFDKTTKMLQITNLAKTGLGKLSAMGDVVEPEDVLEEAGKLVAGGAEPTAIAGLLADMPQGGGGGALASWVAMHAQQIAQTEKQVLQAHEEARQQLGVSAMHVLQAHAGPTGQLRAQASQGAQGQAPGPGMPMGPQGPAAPMPAGPLMGS